MLKEYLRTFFCKPYGKLKVDLIKNHKKDKLINIISESWNEKPFKQHKRKLIQRIVETLKLELCEMSIFSFFHFFVWVGLSPNTSRL